VGPGGACPDLPPVVAELPACCRDWRYVPGVCSDCMAAAAMLLGRHRCGIHAVWPGTGDAGVTAGAPGSGAAAHATSMLTGNARFLIGRALT